jgi:hypothetical protein
MVVKGINKGVIIFMDFKRDFLQAKLRVSHDDLAKSQNFPNAFL